MTPPEHTTDLLVVGSGAAAMAAAIRAADLGLDVVMVEKSAVYGGSTAMSGGVIWVADNPWMKLAGLADSEDDARTYLRHITGEHGDPELLDTYVRESKRMLVYLSDRAHLEVAPLTEYTDYYPEAPGGKGGGRSVEPAPFDGGGLGEAFRQLHPPAPSALVMGRLMITARAAKSFIVLGWRSLLTLAWLFVAYGLRWRSRKRWGRDPRLTNGNALVARLRRALLDREVPLWLQSPARRLLVEGGRVVGAEVERDGTSCVVRARRGVVLACGGFARNLALRERHGPAPASVTWTAAHEGDEGDALALAMPAGAATGLLDDAWWTPVTQVPGLASGWVLVVEKSLPGNIFVNAAGERFTNEAAPYVDVAKAIYDDHQRTGGSIPAWMVFDARYRKKYIAGPVAPGQAVPDARQPRRLRKGFLRRAETLAALAAELGVDPAGLERTCERYSAMARAGVDEDFGRGESASDRYYGDPRVRPNPCMAPIDKPPFYAIPVYPGDLGTKGGVRTDASARALRDDGSVIEGLYAAGNASASIMGRTYPGAGGTIGPALTFGFLAAESAARSGDASA